MSKTRDEIAQAYRSEPWWYDVRGFFILTFAYNSTLFEQLRFFGPNFGSRHLEVACGTGTLLELILRWRRWKRLPEVQVTGMDYAESMLAGARHRFRRQPDLRFMHADAAAMPFVSGSFETVNVANAVHCFPDVRGALRDILRVLTPQGTMAANVLLFPKRGWPVPSMNGGRRKESSTRPMGWIKFSNLSARLVLKSSLTQFPGTARTSSRKSRTRSCREPT